MKNIKLTLLFFAFFFQLLVYSQSGKVVKIKDGDTIVILDDLNNQTTLRLAQVDCPETGQPFGKQAKKFTADQVGMKNITYKVVSIDRYNRTIAKVFYDGKYLSQELIKNGLGWHYKQYSTSKELAKDEQKAKDQKRGLWKDKKALEPWEFRKVKKEPLYYGKY